jgi:rhomboid protease GluP
MQAGVSSSAPPAPRPRPVEVSSGGGLVPPGWLDQAPVTRALLALNITVFVVQLGLTHGRSFVHPTIHENLAFGASYTLATIGENRWETLVTACFLHDGLFHIGFNMLALWQAGPLVERAVGSARMAPMYLLAGAAGNALDIAQECLARSAHIIVGASGAISGVIAAALVVGWRVQGWGGPLTQAMARWLGLVLAFGFFANLTGGNIANAAHFGGALAGAATAASWRRGYRYSQRATAAILTGCAGAVVGCVAVVALHNLTDRFAAMDLEERHQVTEEAIVEGRCGDARDGLHAVERLRAWMAPVTPLRNRVRSACGD